MVSDILFVNVGQILKPHGIRGEVCIVPTTDWPEQFEVNRSFRIIKKGHEPRQIVFKQVRVHKAHFIVQLENVNDRNTAELLRGWDIQIEAESRPELPENEYYLSDLIGLKAVTEAGDLVGWITDIMQQTGQDIYIITKGEKEILIPAVKEFIKEVNLRKQEIIIDPIDGLIE